MSRIVPNSYQTPNLFADRLMAYLTGDEWKTLHYACLLYTSPSPRD